MTGDGFRDGGRLPRSGPSHGDQRDRGRPDGAGRYPRGSGEHGERHNGQDRARQRSRSRSRERRHGRGGESGRDRGSRNGEAGGRGGGSRRGPESARGDRDLRGAAPRGSLRTQDGRSSLKRPRVEDVDKLSSASEDGTAEEDEELAALQGVDVDALVSGRSEEDEAERLRQERKRRREAIMAKHAQAGSARPRPPSPVKRENGPPPGQPDRAQAVPPARGSVAAGQSSAAPPAGEAVARQETAAAAKPATAGFTLPAELESLRSDVLSTLSRVRGADAAGAASGAAAKPAPAASAASTAAAPAAAGSGTGGGGGGGGGAGLDIFAENDDVAVASGGATQAGGSAALADSWDDPEGYYKVFTGETLDGGRYRVLGSHGRGVFSSVLIAVDLVGDGEGEGAYRATRGQGVAVKVLRANDTMRRAGDMERRVCEALAREDKEGKRHCLRLLRHFEHRGHLCLVYEAMHKNLREVIRKFGKRVGLNLSAVRAYGKQLFIALRLMHRLGIVHADLKPDNILANAEYNVVKVCDFGSAFEEDAPDNDPTPYLVSRFYRAPEIILGLRYRTPVDVWALGCCLYELFAGTVMFPGANNNEMLALMQSAKGPFPHRLLRKHLHAYDQLEMEAHFGPDMRFNKHGVDPVTGKPTLRMVTYTKPTRDVKAMLLAKKGPNDDRRTVLQFADLLDSCLALDPAKRISARDALRHPFFQGRAAAAGAQPDAEQDDTAAADLAAAQALQHGGADLTEEAQRTIAQVAETDAAIAALISERKSRT